MTSGRRLPNDPRPERAAGRADDLAPGRTPACRAARTRPWTPGSTGPTPDRRRANDHHRHGPQTRRPSDKQLSPDDHHTNGGRRTAQPPPDDRKGERPPDQADHDPRPPRPTAKRPDQVRSDAERKPRPRASISRATWPPPPRTNHPTQRSRDHTPDRRRDPEPQPNRSQRCAPRPAITPANHTRACRVHRRPNQPTAPTNDERRAPKCAAFDNYVFSRPVGPRCAGSVPHPRIRSRPRPAR
jgi:hypothetical protein